MQCPTRVMLIALENDIRKEAKNKIGLFLKRDTKSAKKYMKSIKKRYQYHNKSMLRENIGQLP